MTAPTDLDVWSPARVQTVATTHLAHLGITDPADVAEIATRWTWAEWRAIAPGCPDRQRTDALKWMRRQAGLPEWHGMLQ
jgi:hypothetical protein